MNTGHDDSHFDQRLRQAHARAVDHVSPRTLAQLRPQRPASRAPQSRLHAWPLAATCAIALIAGGVFLRHPESNRPELTTAVSTPSTVTDNEPGDVYAALDEAPELYLWLASNDTENLALE
jgi:hypothetical protein